MRERDEVRIARYHADWRDTGGTHVVADLAECTVVPHDERQRQIELYGGHDLLQRELRAEIPREGDDRALRLSDARSDRSRQREAERTVTGGMEPHPGTLGGESVVAEVGDLCHVAEHDTIGRQALAHRAQRCERRRGGGCELCLDAGAVRCSISCGGAPAAARGHALTTRNPFAVGYALRKQLQARRRITSQCDGSCVVIA